MYNYFEEEYEEVQNVQNAELDDQNYRAVQNNHQLQFTAVDQFLFEVDHDRFHCATDYNHRKEDPAPIFNTIIPPFITVGNHGMHPVNRMSKISLDIPQKADGSILEDEGLFKAKLKRRIRKIKCNQQTRLLYIHIKKGNKTETTELNINAKTITKNILTTKLRMKYFYHYQERIVKQYLEANPNFSNTRKLFGVEDEEQVQILNQNMDVVERSKLSRIDSQLQVKVNKQSDRIRLVCYHAYSSSRILVEILKSEKMAMKNKLTMLKFLQNIRFGAVFPEKLRKWKSPKTEIQN